MKSGLAAQVIAVEALRRVGLGRHDRPERGRPTRRPSASATPAWAGSSSRACSRPTPLIITEPFGPDGVGIGHKGAIWGEITLHGKQAHGSSAAARRQRRRGDGALPRRRSTRDLRPLLEDAHHRLRRDPAKPALHALLRHDPRRPATNIVPDRCTVTFNRRLMPGRGPRRGAPRAARAAEGAQRYDYHETYSHASRRSVGEDEPVVQAACRAVRDPRPRTAHPDLGRQRRPALRRPQRRHHQLADLRPGHHRPHPRQRRAHLRRGPRAGHEGPRADPRRPAGARVIQASR